MTFNEILDKRVIFFDGAMGSMLQKNGLRPGCPPEYANIENPQLVREIHSQYISAGADVITTNTFGAYAHKCSDVERIITAAVENAKAASNGRLVAFDMGPTGKLLKPMGDLDFEDCYDIFSKNAQLAKESGADLILIETMSDLYEVKAAVLAAKETGLPVCCTMTFDERGRTLTGTDVHCMTALLEGLGVDVMGINCGFGPDAVSRILPALLEIASIPVLLQPNAGLPEVVDGVECYNICPDAYAAMMLEMCEKGATLLGGCCGTTPDHIKAMAGLCKSIAVPQANRVGKKNVACSGSKAIRVTKDAVSVDAIDPLAGSEQAAAMENDDMDYFVDMAMEQLSDGAEIIRIHSDDAEMLEKLVTAIQEFTNAPLMLESASAEAIEKAARVYNGAPVISCIAEDEEEKRGIIAAASKYGGILYED